MNIKEIRKGQKVKNFYGEILTVLRVIDNLMIVVYERNEMYHWTKLSIDGKLIEK